MTQIFRPSTNTVARASIFGFVFFVAGAMWLADAVSRSPWVTRNGVVREQPVPFDHAKHVGELGLDCRHCHTTVETAAFAGVPATKTCMTCHSQVLADDPALEPIKRSFEEDRSVAWVRVHDLPDFVAFNHSIHVAKGVGCVTCHGRIDTMPVVSRAADLDMGWCLDCHRSPEQHLRSRDEVFSMEGSVHTPRSTHDASIREATDCSSCHR